MHFYLISILNLIFFVGCTSSGLKNKTDLCKFKNEPVVIKKQNESLLQYWEFETGSLSDKKDFENLKYFNSYQRRIKNEVKDLKQETLRARSYPLEKPGDQQNMRVVKPLLSSVRKINCQEALLLDLQGSRVDLVKKPTEFLAFEFHKKNKKRLLYYTSNSEGIRALGYIHQFIQTFIDEGWELRVNIHNHILNLNDDNFRGTIGPSVSDAFVYQMELKDFNLPKAIITNGFDSLEIPSNVFSMLSTVY